MHYCFPGTFDRGPKYQDTYCVPRYYILPYCISIWRSVRLSVWRTKQYVVLHVYICPVYQSVCLSAYWDIFVCLPTVCWLICLSLCLSINCSVCLSVYLLIGLSVCLSVDCSVCVSIDWSVCLSVCLSIDLSVCLSISVFLSIDLSVCLSISLSVCRLICLSICPPVRLPYIQLWYHAGSVAKEMTWFRKYHVIHDWCEWRTRFQAQSSWHSFVRELLHDTPEVESVSVLNWGKCVC